MRIKSTVFVLVLAAIPIASTIPIAGQEEPLPAIQAKLAPQVFLAVDPIHTLAQPTLADAVRANDYTSFDTLYREAVKRGEAVGAYATLHELWTYSINDPIGAFYGPELHDRLARAYPGYAKFIDEYRIVDNNGNVFYPTSETRAFLLDRAVEGRGVTVQVAETRRAPARDAAASAGEDAGAPRASTPSRASGTSRVSRSSRILGTPVAGTARVATTTRVSATPPVETSSSSPTPPIVIQAPAPVVVTPAAVQPIQPAADPASRGILLLVIGLIGIGVLAVMLRTPREVPAAPDKVEPLRMPTAEPTPPQQQQRPSGKNRANGSRG